MDVAQLPGEQGERAEPGSGRPQDDESRPRRHAEGLARPRVAGGRGRWSARHSVIMRPRRTLSPIDCAI
ncbi:hypothetical protein BG28_07270 [Nesterenkonia sp. AN1]|nr:hypothetical protein BG28_07270 [Nesterenkonia sp. AN1]